MTQSEWTYPVSLKDAPVSGGTYNLEADRVERTAIAARLGVPTISSLKAELTLTPQAGGALITGLLDAVLSRICIVSLEPMEELIHEEIYVAFSRDAATVTGGGESGEDLNIADHEPEPLEGDIIDLAEFTVQQTALAMAPYPRKAGARPLAEDFGKTGDASPFSILKPAQIKPQNNQ